MNRNFKFVLWTDIEIYQQGYVYNTSHIFVCFEILIGDYEDETGHATRSALNTDKQTSREENIHTRHKLIETGKQRRNEREGDRGYYW